MILHLITYGLTFLSGVTLSAAVIHLLDQKSKPTVPVCHHRKLRYDSTERKNRGYYSSDGQDLWLNTFCLDCGEREWFKTPLTVIEIQDGGRELERAIPYMQAIGYEWDADERNFLGV